MSIESLIGNKSAFRIDLLPLYAAILLARLLLYCCRTPVPAAAGLPEQLQDADRETKSNICQVHGWDLLALGTSYGGERC